MNLIFSFKKYPSKTLSLSKPSFFQKAFLILLGFTLLSCTLILGETPPSLPPFGYVLPKEALQDTVPISKEQAQSLAETFLANQGYKKQGYSEIKTLLIQEEKSHALFWSLSFFLPEREAPPLIHWLLLDSKTGQVPLYRTDQHLQEGNSIWVEIHDITPFYHLSLQEQALYSYLFQSSQAPSRYISPEEGFISQEEALSLGEKSIFDEYKIPKIVLDTFTPTFYLMEDFFDSPENPPVYLWILSFRDETGRDFYQVDINALTGEVLVVHLPSPNG